MGRRLGKRNHLVHSHKPVNRGAENAAQASRGHILVGRRGVGVAEVGTQWLSRKNAFLVGTLRIDSQALHPSCKWALTLPHKRKCGRGCLKDESG